MSLPTLRFGLVGTGRIGQVHAANLLAHPDLECAWVADPVIEQAEALAARLGAVAGPDARELIERGGVDAIIVASPTLTHVGLIEAGVRAGVAVLCEKPIDLDLDRARSIAPLVSASNVPVAIGFNRRFDPSFARVRALVGQGQIGDLEQLTIVSRDPAPPPAAYLAHSGGIFRDMTIHDFDMARFFLPGLSEVFATGSALFDAGARQHDDLDTAVVVLRDRHGRVATILNSRHSAAGYDQRIEAFGSDGAIEVGNPSTSLVRRSSAGGVGQRDPFEPFFLERYERAYRAELDAFARLVRGEDSQCPTFLDGLAALALAEAAAASIRTGATVTVDYAEFE